MFELLLIFPTHFASLQLEEKDELIEARDEQIADLKSRVDQARKMNDALRSLIEKDSGTERVSSSSR